MTSSRGKLIKGAAILGIAGVIVKFLGAFLRVPLTNWIGDEGMSYYSTAYTVYAVLLVMSTAGMPVAISRLVSENIALKRYRNAHRVFQTAFMIMLCGGTVAFLICFFAGGFIAESIGNAPAASALRAVAPALLFVPLVASFRGYFNGRQNMKPAALSEVCEQLIRVSVGLFLAHSIVSQVGNGLSKSETLAKAASGATFGATAGSIGAFLIVGLIYLLNKRVISKKCDRNLQDVEDRKTLVRKIITIAIPIIIGSEVMPLMTLIDTSVVVNTLHDAGWSLKAARAQYGLLAGFCSTLIAFPQIFTQSVSVSLVPSVASAYKVKNLSTMRDNISVGARMTMILAFPCALGIFALARPILFLLYPLQKESAVQAVPALMVMAISVIFLAMTQTFTGVLQAVGKQNIPVRNLLLGCIVKLIFTIFLVSRPSLNIVGAVLGTNAAYIFSMSLNYLAVRKYTKAKISVPLVVIKPFISAALMALIAKGIHMGLEGIIGNSIATLLAIALGGMFYGIMILVTGAISTEELKTMPMGNKLYRIVSPITKFLKRN